MLTCLIALLANYVDGDDAMSFNESYSLNTIATGGPGRGTKDVRIQMCGKYVVVSLDSQTRSKQ